ncbi:MAG: ABC transporter ATP-binding protein [Rickettsiaceae bacterium]|nr:ABC transporter ATP-binding protein [Rickettsiaceae bacterium]
MEKLPKTVIPFMFHFMKKQPIAFLAFWLTPLLLVVETVVVPYALKMIIDATNEYESNREIIMEIITPALWLGGGMWLLMISTARLQEWWQVYVIPKLEADIRITTTKYLIGHSYNYFINNLAGDLANKVNYLPQALDEVRMIISWRVISAVGIIITTLIIMLTIQPFFSLITGIWIFSDLLSSVIFVKYISISGKEDAEAKNILSGRIVDTIVNIGISKIFAKQSHELNHIKTTQEVEKVTNTKVKSRIVLFRFAKDIIATAMLVLIVYLLITNWQQEKITTGEFVFIFNTIWGIMYHLWVLGENLGTLFKNYSIASRTLQVITEPHDVIDIENAKELKVASGDIVFNNVSFHYNYGKNLFTNKNIIIKPREKVGLVGFSGSGKTSFVNLILRFFDVESGVITIDGQNIAEVTQTSLRENISMIPQDTTLFHRTLFENIQYGNINASEEEVIEASKKAHCHEFIMELPQGYETLVGERGIKLSGGQRQRIAIARAILKNSSILILDEATSALDSVTEKYIQEALVELMENKTTIIIAHRLSTLSKMDRILVFDKGQIIEDGSHAELLKNDNYYARMWKMQDSGFLPDKDQNSKNQKI